MAKVTKTHLKVFNTCSCWPGWSGWLRWVPLKVGGIQGAKIIAITPPYFFSFPFIIPFVSCSLSFFSFSFLVLFSISNLTSFSVSTSLLFLYICIAPTLTLFHPLFMFPFFLYFGWQGMNNQKCFMLVSTVVISTCVYRVFTSLCPFHLYVPLAHTDEKTNAHTFSLTHLTHSSSFISPFHSRSQEGLLSTWCLLRKGEREGSVCRGVWVSKRERVCVCVLEKDRAREIDREREGEEC